MKVAIIGAGIAGLTTALGLKKAGVSFVIYEGAQEIKPVGTGIIIANNAMQVYRYFGLDDKIRQRGNRISAMNITDMKLKVLSKNELKSFEEKYSLTNVAIHRASLHQLLVGEVGEENIVVNKRLAKVEKGNTGEYTLSFEDGTTAEYAYVIGADGVNSKTRKYLFGDMPLRQTKQICWRGVTEYKLPEKYQHELVEGWGKGKRFGIVKLDGNKVYWYFLLDEDIYNKAPSLSLHLSDCDSMISELIKNTPESGWYKNDLYDLAPMDVWYKNRVCLIGDAAHATTPNLGQGACQAIEDAYVISKLLEQHSLEDALKKFPEVRRSKAHFVVNTSWKVGKMGHLRNPLLIALRNAVLKLTPSTIGDKQLSRLFELDKIE